MIRCGCDNQDRLAPLLAGRVATDEETAWVAHLEVCEDCRRRLEALAANEDDWSAAGEFLRDTEPAGATRDFAGLPEEDGHSSLSFLAPTDDPSMLGRLGPYEVMGVVGHGGMSVVLKAFDRALNRNVAVKALAPQLAANALARRRFAREARAAAAVVHEHVVPIYAVAEAGGIPYLVMPYYPGGSLQRRIDEAGPLGTAETLRIARQIAGGLAAAHAQGLVHRDVKPANVLLERGVERAVVADFGLARTVDDASLTCSGIIAGTPQYMSPEQARGDAADHRSDLFSLGSVIYAMCTGRAPFRADTTLGVLRRICDDEPRPIRGVNPEVPAWLADLVAKLHAKDAADRFRDSAEVTDLLERYLAHVQNPITIPEPPRPSIRRGRSGGRRSAPVRRLAALLCIGLVVSLAGAGIWSIAHPTRPGGSSGNVRHEAASATDQPDSIQPPQQVNASWSPDAAADEQVIARALSQVRDVRRGWFTPAVQPRAPIPDPVTRLRSKATSLRAELEGVEL